jgi:8-oxo-dGTP pyrophosphatase MutT (NUDIX family)
MKTLKESLKERLQAYTPKIVEAPDRIPAAVLVPFFERNGKPHILFTKRTEVVQHHPGEICFPGGSREDSDSDLLATALRELKEEVSVEPETVEVLGRMDAIKTVSSSFLVVPYVGFLQPDATFHPNLEEVQEILEVPFDHLLRPEIFRAEEHVIDRRPLTVYYYQWEAHTIWGVTARILKSVLDLLEAGQE